MKQYVATLFLMIFAFIASSLPSAAYSKYIKLKMNANPSDRGLVYVSLTDEGEPDRSKYKSSIDEALEIGDNGIKTSLETDIYIYTIPIDGTYEFANWVGVASSTSSKTTVRVKGLGSKTATNSYTFTANYTKVSYVTINYNKSDFGNNGGTPELSISNAKNKLNEEITISAQIPVLGNGITDVNGNEMANSHFYFSHWEKTDGTFVSDANPYTFTVAEEADLVARFNFTTSYHGKGYYRIKNCKPGSKQYLKAIGNMEFKSSDFSVHDHIDLNPIWTLTEYFKDSDGNAIDAFREDDPSTIFYYESSMTEDYFNNIANYGTYSTHGSNDVFTSQGVSYPQFNLGTYHFQLYSGAYPGSVAIKSPRNSKDQWLEYLDDGSGLQFRSSATGVNSTFELEPVDIEGGDFYFGAIPDEKSEYDGHYYTTMFTAFPYKCMNGVEAYYLRYKQPTAQDTTYYEIVPFIDGIVPANTAVILKCLDINASLNRLIPLDPNGTYTTVSDNLLKGVIQLNQGAKDDPSMYQFNNSWAENSDFKKSEEGQYLFMITEEDPNDTEEPWAKPARINHKWLPDDLQSEVCPSNFVKVEPGSKVSSNAAYLDVNQLASNLGRTLEAMPQMLSVIPGKIPTGLTDMVDNQPVDNSWYTLSGVRIDNPRKGEVYIHNKKKVIF